MIIGFVAFAFNQNREFVGQFSSTLSATICSEGLNLPMQSDSRDGDERRTWCYMGLRADDALKIAARSEDKEDKAAA